MFIRGVHTTAVSIGEIIKDLLAARGWTQKEFATRIGYSEKHVCKIMDGAVHLTDETALRLESIFSISCASWLRFDARFRADKLKVEMELALAKEQEILRLLPYRELVKNAWIQEGKTVAEKICACRQFFGVADLTILPSLIKRDLVCKTKTKALYASFCWLQQARNLSLTKETDKPNARALTRDAIALRPLTLLKAEKAQRELEKFFAPYGIALVILKPMKESFLNVISEKMGEKILLALKAPEKEDPLFWFTLMNEVGQLALRSPRKKIVSQEESMLWAKDTLIAKTDYERLLAKKDFSRRNIIDFAETLGISPNLVIARLQMEKRLPAKLEALGR